MIDCRLPRQLATDGATTASPGLRLLHAAWDWLRETDDGAAQIATSCPDLRAICPAGDHWVLTGVSDHGHGASVTVDAAGSIIAIMGLPVRQGGFLRVARPVPVAIIARSGVVMAGAA